jgi:hypothetical protein
VEAEDGLYACAAGKGEVAEVSDRGVVECYVEG